MIRRLVVGGLVAGAGAGLVAGLLQLVFVQPVLLQAELYETGALTHFGAGAEHAHAHSQGMDLLRDGMSLLFSAALYAGFGLMMAAALLQAEAMGRRIDVGLGATMGVAGFAVFLLAPGFSLPPETPGVAAAEIGPRQVWWASTVLLAAVAMALLLFGGRPLAWAGAAALLVAPHLWGAPEPDGFAGAAPPEIAGLFAARVFGVGLAVWVLLGALCARLVGADDGTRAA